MPYTPKHVRMLPARTPGRTEAACSMGKPEAIGVLGCFERRTRVVCPFIGETLRSSLLTSLPMKSILLASLLTSIEMQYIPIDVSNDDRQKFRLREIPNFGRSSCRRSPILDH
jgi:hypothetical protein